MTTEVDALAPPPLNCPVTLYCTWVPVLFGADPAVGRRRCQAGVLDLPLERRSKDPAQSRSGATRGRREDSGCRAPPRLRRRGAAARRGEELSAVDGLPALQQEVERRGAARVDQLRRLGIDVDQPAQLRREGEWLVTQDQWDHWIAGVVESLAHHDRAHPLQPGLPLEAVRRAVDVPEAGLVPRIAVAAGLEVSDGRVRQIGSKPSLRGG